MNQNLFFTPTNILLPAHADMRRWSVIACDQFTSDAAYWRAVQDTVGDAPSTLRLMLPEFYLGKCDEAAATRTIQQTMHAYLDSGVFRTVPHSLVLVQRTLPGGAVRCGIVGALDLEAYDYAPDSVTPIRATEGHGRLAPSGACAHPCGGGAGNAAHHGLLYRSGGRYLPQGRGACG